MRLLSSLGVFTQTGNHFGLTPVGELLQSHSSRSMRDLAVMFNDPWSTAAWTELPHSVRTGGDGVTKAFGKNTFELFHDEPDQAANFHAAMTNFSRSVVDATLEAYDFSHFSHLADVGGGHGVLLGSILRHTPGLRGVLFDLPEVLAGAPAAGHLASLEDRVELQPGGFFETVPTGVDAYILKSIIHDWSDDHSRRILRLLRDQLAACDPENGRVLLCEMVVPDNGAPAPAKFLDIEMLVCTIGGKERTASTFSASRSAILAYLFPSRADWVRALGKQGGDSRIWAGIHYQIDNESGVALGESVAQKFIDWASKDGSQ